MYPGVLGESAISCRVHDHWKTGEEDISTLLKDPLTFLFHWLSAFGQFCLSMNNSLTLPISMSALEELPVRVNLKGSRKCCSSPGHSERHRLLGRTKAMPMAPPDGEVLACSHRPCERAAPALFTCKGGHVQGRCVFSPWLLLFQVSVLKSWTHFVLWVALLDLVSCN